MCQQPRGYVKLGPNCRHWNKVVHELMHTLCFTHEFERYDRDKWMRHVGCGAREAENIKYTPQELLFDYLSATNYPCNECRVPDKPQVENCSSSKGISVLDADKINSLYNCQGKYSHRWRKGRFQENLFNGGYHDNSYICRTYFEGNLIPGLADKSVNSCVIYDREYNEFYISSRFDILTNSKESNIRWIKHSDNQVPKNAIKGGQMNNGEILYIGRCWIFVRYKQLVVMKIQSSDSSSFFNQRIFVKYYEKFFECKDKEVLVNEG
jgi:hypothetical protein